MPTTHRARSPAVPPITRRDFFNGVALGLGGLGSAAAQAQAGAGFAGQTDAAAARMHALRDGTLPASPPAWQAGDETADLVVVGAGISGLAAARLYLQHSAPGTRVLLLDALPEIGGHAIRNEFIASNGQRLIGYGGSEALDSPSQWSPAALSLLAGVGIDLAQFTQFYDTGWRQRQGLTQAAQFCAASVWGRDVLVRHAPGADAADWLAQTPLHPAAQADLARLMTAPPDPWPALTRSQKRAQLARITYDQLITQVMGLHPQVATWLNHRTKDELGAGTDACSALDAWAVGLPGFGAMNLGTEVDAAMSPTARKGMAGSDPYIFHLPDGNAGLVRALLRTLIPQALPGSGIESLVLAQRDDHWLDHPDSPVRVRLNSTVLRVAHSGPVAQAGAVDVGYADAQGRLRTVRAGQVVLACFHRAIPLLCPELPAAQVLALNDQVKVPLLYATVLLRQWQALAKAGISGFELPGHLFGSLRIDMPVSVGSYRFAQSPDQPVLLHASAVVMGGPVGRSEREQAAAGRQRLQALRFEDVERELRNVLQGALGPFGLQADRDIEAITLNRWSHGYAYEYMRPWDAYWPEGPLPITTARQGWGRIAIANADAGAYAYVHSAIDQATRAVGELLPQARLPAHALTPGPDPKSLGLQA
jgi:spermidine dehydrogenase